MKKTIISLFLLLIEGIAACADNNPFTLNTTNAISHSISRIFTAADSITPFSTSTCVYALSMSGQACLYSDRSHIRVLLEDSHGKEYQVMECCRMLSESDTVTFSSYCEDTYSLHGIIPQRIKIFVTNAYLQLDTLYTLIQERVGGYHKSSIVNYDSIVRRRQAESIVNKINAYNKRKGKMWWAGVTTLALKDYSERKKMMGIIDGADTQGLEYYAGGIFEVGYAENDSVQQHTNQRDSISTDGYVPYFDWRNRHGRNWVTPIRNQGRAGYCWAFSAIAAIESSINLKYNQSINPDLSELDVAYYTYGMDSVNNIPAGYDGGQPIDALEYISTEGVIDEGSLPYNDSPTPNLPVNRTSNYQYIARIDSFSEIRRNGDITLQLKHSLINKGVLCSGVCNDMQFGIHSMALVGYGTISEEDSLVSTIKLFFTSTGNENNPRFGKTYWIYKNSWGENPQYIGEDYHNVSGYIYVYYADIGCMVDASIIETPATLDGYSDYDIFCEDSDGDGYYFWGIGSKPTSCPSWVPDEPDGDDSDYTKGPMDEYGWLRDLDPDDYDTLYIDTDSTWNTYRYQHHHVCIRNNATLSVCDTIKCYHDVSITIQPNATLSVNGGTIEDAEIKPQAGGNVKIQNNGHIIPCTNKNFSVPLGAKMRIDYGRIK